MDTTDVQYGSHSARQMMPRPSLGVAGFLIFLLGAWGGIVPFIGPTFGYSADSAGSWHWDLAHALLSVVPGAAACVVGLLIMMGVTKMSHLAVTGLAGFLAVIAGAWFVIGAVAWPVLYTVPSFFAPGTALTELEYFIGYFGGVGCLLIALGAFVLGRSAAAR